jgi:hypothetical protein
MISRKLILVLVKGLLASSCGLLDLDHLALGEITETRDIITEDIKYTSERIEKTFNSKAPLVSYKGNNQASIEGAIK